MTDTNFKIRTAKGSTHEIKRENDIWYINTHGKWNYILCVVDVDVFEKNMMSSRADIIDAIRSNKIRLAYSSPEDISFNQPGLISSANFPAYMVLFQGTSFQFNSTDAVVEILFKGVYGNTTPVKHIDTRG